MGGSGEDNDGDGGDGGDNTNDGDGGNESRITHFCKNQKISQLLYCVH